MKTRMILALSPLLLAACVYPAQSSDYNQKPSPPEPISPEQARLEIRELTEEAIRALGITPDTLVTAVGPRGQPILFIPKGIGVERFQFPLPAQQITSVLTTTISNLQQNPGCFVYQDTLGNQLLLPTPPCR